jgi:hypothetical protein
MAIDKDEQRFINTAFRFLDRPSFLIRAANAVGRPLELVMRTLPARHQEIIHSASESALKKGLLVVTKTVSEPLALQSFESSENTSRKLGRWHSAASFGVGAAGGFFGIISLPLELPVTTAIMLRSIAATAAEFGMDLRDPQVQLECLYILSLGSPLSKEDDAMSSAYWSSRTAFAKMAREAAAFLVGKTTKDIARQMEKHAAPVLVKFLGAIASRFEVVVSEKMMAEALPIVGAIGGGVINAAFTDYFSDAARFHFGLRALENRHGREAVEKCYNKQMRAP